MGEVINLKRARKEKARAEKEKKAAENRVAFGRTKEEKQHQAAQRALDETRHESHRKDDGEPTD